MPILRKFYLLSTMLLISTVLMACSLAPDYEQPKMNMPEAWLNVKLSETPIEQDWWNRFNDPTLTKLIEEALANNKELDESLAKIDSAAAKIGQARSALFPSLSATGGTSRALSSVMGSSAQKKQYDSGIIEHDSVANNNLGLSAAWELDFWGKYRNSYTGLSDVLLNTKVGYEALRLSIAKQVAQSYFTLLAYDMQLSTAERTYKSRKKALQIYSERYKQGAVTEFDYLRAATEMELSRASMLNTIVDRDTAEASLAVLLGRSPKEILGGKLERSAVLKKLAVPPVLPEGLPSELLLRRPDIRAAEYMIMAYNANIGVVKADLFPSISLTGALGTLSFDAANLFSGPSGTWSYGVGFAMPLLDFGRRWYAIDDAEALKRQAIAVYSKTVQNAFMDLRTALTAQRESVGIVQSIQKQVNNMRRAVEIARLQYDNGYTDYLSVLDSERQLFSAELQLATAMSARLFAAVRVCTALGGGWQDTSPLMGTRAEMQKKENK